jgi:hypothetical protein
MCYTSCALAFSDFEDAGEQSMNVAESQVCERFVATNSISLARIHVHRIGRLGSVAMSTIMCLGSPKPAIHEPDICRLVAIISTLTRRQYGG